MKLLLVFDIAVDGDKNIDPLLIECFKKLFVAKAGQSDLRNRPTIMRLKKLLQTFW